ncbi:MAG: hypothetical protein LBJ46_08030 [Planctomycetota bacterium]|jgi:formate hydrogenlyase subunit 3/multisubunit Na+/H+ antiporter MnhD subunit|nr:hypothetical protein [Planctomycetota bacterium]
MIRLLPLLAPLLAVLSASALPDSGRAFRVLVLPLAAALQLALAMCMLIFPGFSRSFSFGRYGIEFLALASAVLFAVSLRITVDLPTQRDGAPAKSVRIACTAAALVLLAATALCMAGGIISSLIVLAGMTLALAPMTGFLGLSVGIADRFFMLAALALASTFGGALLVFAGQVRAGMLFAAVGLASLMLAQPLAAWLPDLLLRAPTPVRGLAAGVVPPGAFLVLLRIRDSATAADGRIHAGALMSALGAIAVAAALPVLLLARSRPGLLCGVFSLHAGFALFCLGGGGVMAGVAAYHVFAFAPVAAALVMSMGCTPGCRRGDSVGGGGAARSLWLCGGMACLCLPPFGTFPTLLQACGFLIGAGDGWIVAVIGAALTLVAYKFLALASTAGGFRETDGKAGEATADLSAPEDADGETGSDFPWELVPPLPLLFASALLGVASPEWLGGLIFAVGTPGMPP